MTKCTNTVNCRLLEQNDLMESEKEMYELGMLMLRKLVANNFFNTSKMTINMENVVDGSTIGLLILIQCRKFLKTNPGCKVENGVLSDSILIDVEMYDLNNYRFNIHDLESKNKEKKSLFINNNGRYIIDTPRCNQITLSELMNQNIAINKKKNQEVLFICLFYECLI